MGGDERPILTIDGVTARENRLINHFFHDFKGELSTVLMCLQALNDGLVGDPPGPSQRRWLAHAIDNSRHMVQLINDYRDLTLMEEGAFPLVAERVELGARLEALFAEARAQARERGQDVAATQAPLPDVVFGAQLFDRLVRNVLQVALYNSRCGTTLQVDASSVDDEAGRWLDLAVRFEGVTFPAERLATVFDKLAQTHEGLQLGRGYTLLFCHEAARTLGGRLHLSSWEGRGNDVRVRLPLTPVQGGEA